MMSDVPKILVCTSADFAKVAEAHLIDAMRARVAQAFNHMVTLCCPTGNTPQSVNARLRAACDPIWALHVQMMHLDERVGESAFADQIEALARDLGVPDAHLHLINGLAGDVQVEAARYGALVARSKPDIYVCGTDAIEGHLAFNPKHSRRADFTRVVDLSDDVQAQQKAYEDGAQATQGITVGMGEILDDSALLHLWVSGPSKATILGQAFNGEIDPAINISLAREKGARMVVIADEEAATDLLADSLHYDLEYVV